MLYSICIAKGFERLLPCCVSGGIFDASLYHNSVDAHLKPVMGCSHMTRPEQLGGPIFR